MSSARSPGHACRLALSLCTVLPRCDVCGPGRAGRACLRCPAAEARRPVLGDPLGPAGPILPAASVSTGQAQPLLGRGFGRPLLFLLLRWATSPFLLLDVTWDIRELGESAVPAGPVFRTTAEATLKPLPFRGPEPLTPVGRRWGVLLPHGTSRRQEGGTQAGQSCQDASLG